MPRTTVITTHNLALPNVEVTFATLAPTFDRINAYADFANARNISITWRLYATTTGIRTLVWELPKVVYSTPTDPISGDGALLLSSLRTIAADVYELTASLDVAIAAPISVTAGVIGFDDIVNDAPPETNGSVASLVYDTPIVFGQVSGAHMHFQTELDLNPLGQSSTSLWTIYAIIVDGPKSIGAPIARKDFNATEIPSLTSIFFRLDGVGADIVRLTGTSLVNDPALLAANPVAGTMTGFSDTLDGTGGGGGGITQLTQDVLAGPGAGAQSATVVEATGELIPASGGVWGLPIKPSSLFFYRDPSGGQTSFVRVPGVVGSNPFTGYSFLSADDARNVTVGYGGFSAGCNALTLESPVTYINRSGRLVAKTKAANNNSAMGLWFVQQPAMFGNIETYLGGAAPFVCDTTLYATSFIECRFPVGGGGGTVSLSFFVGADPGRVLHIGDGTGTISVADPLIIQPPPGVAVGGGLPGAALTITTAGWAQKLVLNSTGDNWMIF